jgi:DNA-binding FadR family transcriptional regulator
MHAAGTDRAALTRDARRARRPGRLASIVVDELAREIIGGELAEGDVLPTEDALCRRFGFSRTVMREGLKLLEERGLIRVEQGRGTTVQPRESWNLLDPDVLRIALDHDEGAELLDNLVTVRRLLETSMARAAATRLSAQELAQMRETIDTMAGLIDDYEYFRQLDQAFHRILMRASGNEIGTTIVRAIHQYTAADPRLNSRPGSKRSLTRTLAEHRAIQEALEARDGELAASRLAAHIDASWEERRNARVTADGGRDLQG